MSAKCSAAPKRKHRVWVNNYLTFRPQIGAYDSLMRLNTSIRPVELINHLHMLLVVLTMINQFYQATDQSHGLIGVQLCF